MNARPDDLAAQEAAIPLDAETTAELPPRPTDDYDEYHALRPTLTRPQRVLPPKPENATPEQPRERGWMFGSGN
jgi:hypothetical protein